MSFYSNIYVKQDYKKLDIVSYMMIYKLNVNTLRILFEHGHLAYYTR